MPRIKKNKHSIKTYYEMADKKKSIVEKALLDLDRINEALNSNTQEILRSIAKEEIDGLVKESLTEDDYEEEEIEDTDIAVADDAEAEVEAGDEEGVEDVIDYEGGEEEMDDMDGGEEMSYDDEESADDYEMDMTGASDEDVIAVYKKLAGEDEIEVVSDTEVVIKDPQSGNEYQVKLGGETEAEVEDVVDVDAEGIYGESEGAMTEDEDVTEEVVFEVELDEDEEINESETKIGATANGNPRTATSDIETSMTGDIETGDIEGTKAAADADSGDNLQGGFDEDGANGSGDAHAEHIMEEDEVTEEVEEVTETEEVTEDEQIDEKIQVGMADRVANGKTEIEGAGARNESVSIDKYNALLAESKALKAENEEFRTSLKKFRKMLGETVVFNSNLTYVTKLFMEHSTTKDEKQTILKRFDEEVSTLKESKKLYKSIVNELGTKKPMSESVEDKISDNVVSSSSTQLNESTAYVDKGTSRIIDLINRTKNR
jgi:hypothetical protein